MTYIEQSLGQNEFLIAKARFPKINIVSAWLILITELLVSGYVLISLDALGHRLINRIQMRGAASFTRAR